MVDDLGLFNLISPCVIPSSKVKNDLNNLNPGVFYPPLPPLKEIEREYSSEGFKDSEESEFLLDDRGMKDKKRSRERLQRELERINGRRKIKKIKKKRPSSVKYWNFMMMVFLYFPILSDGCYYSAEDITMLAFLSSQIYPPKRKGICLIDMIDGQNVVNNQNKPTHRYSSSISQGAIDCFLAGTGFGAFSDKLLSFT